MELRGSCESIASLQSVVVHPVASASSYLQQTTAPALMECCPICAEDNVPELYVWGDAPCTHAMCPTCCVRHLRLELGHPGNARVACAVPGCGRPISRATLAAAAAWRPPAGSADVSAELRPLGADALARAEARLREAELEALRAAMPGIEVHACPFSPCAAILTGEPPSSGEGAAAGMGRVVLCSGCDGRVCASCCLAWDAQGVLSHSGLPCSAVRERRAAALIASQRQPAPQSSLTPQADAAAVASGNIGSLMLTFKQCPQCGTGVSHYRGHACHHIGTGMGCPGCLQAGFPAPLHFCYVCLGPWPCINAASNGCNTFCDPTCDCADCPDCSAGKPCPNCSGMQVSPSSVEMPRIYRDSQSSEPYCLLQGGCRVCSGETLRGPQSDAAWLEKKRVATQAKLATGWGGPKQMRALVDAPVIQKRLEQARRAAGVVTIDEINQAVRAIRAAPASPAAAVATAVHGLTALMAGSEARSMAVKVARAGEAVAAAFRRCAEAATSADGDGASSGIPPLMVCETILEFFEVAVAPATDLRRQADVKVRRLVAVCLMTNQNGPMPESFLCPHLLRWLHPNLFLPLSRTAPIG